MTCIHQHIHHKNWVWGRHPQTHHLITQVICLFLCLVLIVRRDDKCLRFPLAESRIKITNVVKSYLSWYTYNLCKKEFKVNWHLKVTNLIQDYFLHEMLFWHCNFFLQKDYDCVKKWVSNLTLRYFNRTDVINVIMVFSSFGISAQSGVCKTTKCTVSWHHNKKRMYIVANVM